MGFFFENAKTLYPLDGFVGNRGQTKSLLVSVIFCLLLVRGIFIASPQRTRRIGWTEKKEAGKAVGMPCVAAPDSREKDRQRERHLQEAHLQEAHRHAHNNNCLACVNIEWNKQRMHAASPCRGPIAAHGLTWSRCANRY